VLSLGPIGFAMPAALLALLLLPALWWLLRVTPPAPLRVRFPPVRLLAALAPTEDTVERTPPWLLALRLTLVAAVIVGLARPLIDAPEALPGRGPLILVMDDGWASGAGWTARVTLAESLIGRAERDGRAVLLVGTAPTADGDGDLRPVAAATALQRLRALQPKPWPTRRRLAVDRLSADPGLHRGPSGAVVWLADGLADEDGGAAADLVTALRPLGAVTVALTEAARQPLVLSSPERRGEDLVVRAMRAGGDAAVVGDGNGPVVRAVGDDGAALARTPLQATAGGGGEAVLSLPAELRRQLARVEVEGADTAAGVLMMDDRWRRRPVGVVDAAAAAGDLPLLGTRYYLERALESVAEVRRGRIDTLLARDLSLLIVADGGVAAADRDRVQGWVRGGGVLLRFAGPGLGEDESVGDPLLPVPLRAGDRVMGGSLAWRRPAHLAPFPPTGPFAGLHSAADIEVRRQVLAEPSPDLAAHTWAALDDGTPLITARRVGDGWLVLIHTTANTDWSNLPLSGLFVAMLERIVGVGRLGASPPGSAMLPPHQVLDGFGRPGPPPPSARPIAADAAATIAPGPAHPPGLYGDGAIRRAVNLGPAVATVRGIGTLPAGIATRSYAPDPGVDLRPWLLGLALVLALADLAASLALRGLLRPPSWSRRAAAVVVAVAAVAGPARGQAIVADGTAPAAALTTRLAYVVTGDPAVDAVSRAGLAGLTTVVNRRTAAELTTPDGVDPERDELAFYPLLYWPLVAGRPAPSAAAAERLAAYRGHGGTIVFDARRPGGGRSTELAALARGLDLPPLTPAPPDHVLGRAFYLLKAFPGRWSGGTLWVEAGGVHDGVASVIAGDHDWAGAWAVDDLGRPLQAAVPGGERQRELALRFGVNLVMYVLTGSYKADQVHLPAILERIGR
jgi:hypothetical protein